MGGIRVEISVGTVLAFSVFFGLRVFEHFIRVLGRAFGPDLLREKTLYQLLGKNMAMNYMAGHYSQE